MEARMPSRLRGAVIVALLRAMGDEVQLLEDEVFDHYVSSPISVAEGVVLDRWGAIVNEARYGLSDSDYRRIIEAKLLALKAAGRREFIVRMVSLLVEEERVSYSNYVAAYRINVDAGAAPLTATFERRILRLIALSTTAGIQSSVAVGPVGVFRLSTSTGFGSILGKVL
jgi:hypothetical protein